MRFLALWLSWIQSLCWTSLPCISNTHVLRGRLEPATKVVPSSSCTVAACCCFCHPLLHGAVTFAATPGPTPTPTGSKTTCTMNLLLLFLLCLLLLVLCLLLLLFSFAHSCSYSYCCCYCYYSRLLLKLVLLRPNTKTVLYCCLPLLARLSLLGCRLQTPNPCSLHCIQWLNALRCLWPDLGAVLVTEDHDLGRRVQVGVVWGLCFASLSLRFRIGSCSVQMGERALAKYAVR